ncbi:hypothetical protein [Oribacterium sp. P6A1]|uniref:hypothetical protein n=1 Tax=Oribacterium sp. P6A1 TaxID=1410612 RepID=UPI0005679062|nr:hypothetical protein [Oribacterium sp. P6A1]
MNENKYTQFIRNSKEQVEKLGKKMNTALSDEDMANVTGGLGGPNEATCPECGKPMKAVDNPYGDNFWTCDACKIDQFCSDADYIAMIKILEQAGQTQGIVYPVWWKDIPKK